MSGLPYRGTFGARRPSALDALALPPGPMPSHDGLRPLKSWRYIGVYGPELMLCAASVRVGRARQSFWAVWDRRQQRLYERTRLGPGGLRLWRGGVEVRDGPVLVQLALDERAGVETISACGPSYAWTRKQGGVRGVGTVTIDGARRMLDARAVIDDTAAYYPRHTSWRWSAGVGQLDDGREIAWNLVDGVNDSPLHSERTIWIDRSPREVGPCAFDDQLQAVDGLRFTAEAARAHRQNLGLLRSSYRQPFGTFAGKLVGGLSLAEGYGVMEEHDAWW
jgi:hypothetical protein